MNKIVGVTICPEISLKVYLAMKDFLDESLLSQDELINEAVQDFLQKYEQNAGLNHGA